MASYVDPWEMSLGRKLVKPGLSPRMSHKGWEVWYRSQERIEEEIPYAGYLARKDWRYNEEMTTVLLHFAQV